LRVAIIVTARPSYAKAKTIIAALLARGVDVQILACASALLERYGAVVNVIRKDFSDVPITEVWSTYEGANLVTSAKETGALCSELAGVLSRLRPSIGLCIADRHEVLAAAQAIAYQHVPFIHCQGGEKTGSIDDKVRDSITMLADIHCTATERAKWRVYGLTGSDHIYNTGCPSLDLAKQAQSEPPVTVEELGGAGAPIDLNQPFVVVLQHPVTNEMDAASEQMNATLRGAFETGQVICFWPGEDAGADAASKVIRTKPWLHTVRSLPPSRFLRLLTQCACLVGNSSAGIREASYLGVPVVNIGNRQHGRERGPNVVDVGYDSTQIGQAIQTQIQRGVYPSSGLYGRGDAGERIAEVLCDRV
jgi:UDP-hydrolysing UDP-N-acetyl-D-glucosamine 2-epimerase